MKKKRIIFSILLLFIIVGATFALKPRTVQAANPTVVTLRTNKTYTSYDITGDKKKDKILVKIKKNSRYDYYDSLYVNINGKTLYQFTDEFFYAGEYENVDIKIYTLKNGVPFLYLAAYADNGDGPLMEYSCTSQEG